jgi:hypothetical protein
MFFFLYRNLLDLRMNFEEDFADFEEIVGDHGRSGERVAQCVASSQERIESLPVQAEDERSLARAWELFQGKFFSFFISVLLNGIYRYPRLTVPGFGTVLVLKIHFCPLLSWIRPVFCLSKTSSVYDFVSDISNKQLSREPRK